MTAKKAAVFVFAVFMLWSFTGLADTGDKDAEDNITFIVFGDTRVATPGAPIPEAYKRIVEESNIINPDFIFHTGDVIFGYGDSENQLKTEYSSVGEVNAISRAKIYYVPGNHDYNGPLVIKFFKLLTGQNQDYFSFDYKGVGFIVLNTEIPGQVGKVTDKQLEWFKQELERRKNYRTIFVFMHRPLFLPGKKYLSKHGEPMGAKKGFPSEQNRVELVQLMLKYKVDGVFAGHLHLYDRTDYKGIPFVTVGGGGATFSAPVERGGFFHYMIVTVRGDKIKLDLMEPYQLSVETKTYSKDGKSYGEALIHNLHGDMDKGMIPIRGLKFTLPKGNYTAKAEGVVSDAAMLDAAESVLDLDEYGPDHEAQREKIKATMAKYLKPTIFKIEPNEQNKDMVDVWVRLDMPGTFPVRVIVGPSEGQ